MRIASAFKIVVALLLCLTVNAGAIDLGKKLTGRMVGFPLNPPLDSAAGNIFKWPDSASVMVWAMGNDTGATSSQAIYSARTTTVTAAGLAALGIRADSNGTNTPYLVFADSGVILNGGSTARQVVGAVYLWRANCPFITPFTADFYADTLKDEVKTIAGTTQTARDIGASVLLSSGTGTGQISLSSGVAQANMVQVLSNTPDTTGATGRFRVNLGYIGGSAVSTSTAQLGVNTVNVGGTAQTGRDLGASVLLSNGTGTGQVSLSSGKVSLSSPQTFDVTGNITGNLSGSVGSVTGAVGSVTGNVGGISGKTIPTTVASAAGVDSLRDGTAPVKVSSGTGTNQISLTSGRVDVGKVSGTTQTAIDLGAYLPAIMDTTQFLAGLRVNARSRLWGGANQDSLKLYWNTTLLCTVHYWHVGGAANDPPDSTTVSNP